MSATAVQSRFDLFADTQPDGRVSLGERISDVWEGLLSAGSADCPVCRGTMERAGQRGICRDCGSVLS